MVLGLAHSKKGLKMECLYCGGRLVRKTVSYAATREGFHLIIDEVPAWVCEQCGEPLYEEETVEAIQRVLNEVDARLSETVFDLEPA